MNGIINIVGEFLYAFLRCEAAAELAVIVFLIMLVRSTDSPFDSDSLSVALLLMHSRGCILAIELSILTKLCCWRVLGGGRYCIR